MTLRAVHLVYKETRGDIIASGGVDSWEAAAAYMLAGARAVAVGTALFTNPAAPAEIVQGLVTYAERAGFADLAALVGALTA